MWKLAIKSKKEKEVETLREKVTQSSIMSAYKTREKEIESLRKYDRGEKTIIAPDIRALVQSI